MAHREELLFHAARCACLAETSSNPVIAKKFRDLARDYRDLAAETPKQDRDLLLNKRRCPRCGAGQSSIAGSS